MRHFSGLWWTVSTVMETFSFVFRSKNWSFNHSSSVASYLKSCNIQLVSHCRHIVTVKLVTCYSPSSYCQVEKKTKNIQWSFPTLPCRPRVRMNHIPLRFNKMIAGFAFGENKHHVKKFLYFSHQAEKSKVWGQMTASDSAVENAIMYQKCTKLSWQHRLKNTEQRPLFCARWTHKNVKESPPFLTQHKRSRIQEIQTSTKIQSVNKASNLI